MLQADASPVKALFNSVLISGIAAFLIAQLLKPFTNWCAAVSACFLRLESNCIQLYLAYMSALVAAACFAAAHKGCYNAECPTCVQCRKSNVYAPTSFQLQMCRRLI